jgi:hypothetical protein
MTMKANPAATDSTSRELQNLWEALLGAEWMSLAVVPTDHGTSAAPVTAALAALGERHLLPGLRIMDARGATVMEGERLNRDLGVAVAEGERVVIVVDSVMRSLAGIPLLRSAEVVLLVVRVGTSDGEGFASTIGIVGADRIVGSVAVGTDG